MADETIDDVIKIACDKLRDMHAEDLAARIESVASLRTTVAVRQTYEESGYKELKPVRHVWAEDSYNPTVRQGREAALNKLIDKAEKLGITHIFGLEFNVTPEPRSGGGGEYYTVEVNGDGYA